MLNFFKSQKQIIAEIHHEFDSTEDSLLKKADTLFKELNLQTETGIKNKAERLKSVGFINTPLVKKIDEIDIKIGISNSQAELIRYYKQEYPLLKFLTEAELNRICKKYGLIYMPIENYIGDVPDKNLKEIESAKNRKSSDAPSDLIWCELKKDNSFFISSGSGGNWCGIWGKEWYKIPKIIDGVNFRSNYDADSYLKANLGFKTNYLISRIKNYTQDRRGLFICAPKSHFSGMGKSIFSFEVKDPIVFRFVGGGVQVLSKWGLEASDESLVNEKMN